MIMKCLVDAFLDAAHKTLKYGYFAPLTALRFTVTRHGNYFWHLRALYRLTFRCS